MKRAVKFALEHAAALLLLDPGLGKTAISLAAWKILRDEGMSTGAVVFAPLRPAHTTWPGECKKWSDFNDIDLVVLHGAKKDRLVREKHDVYVVNYEAIPWLFNRKRVGKSWKYFITDAGKALLQHADTLIWDEVQNMKHSNTLRYQLSARWVHKFSRRWGLTGSPASNGLLDLFGQCFVVDEGRTLGQYITHYRAQYFLPLDDQGWSWRLQTGAEKAIYKRLKPLALRLDADDYIKMPKQMDHVIKFELPAKARKHYEELEEKLLTQLEQHLIVAPNKGSAVSKCRQVCSGALYLPGRDPVTGEALAQAKNHPWKLIHNEKLDAFVDLVDGLQGQQLLVGYEFLHDLERLLKAFPKTPHIGGGVTVKRGAEIEAAWNRGDIPMLFGQPKSISRGLNLQGSNAHHVAWFTLTWDWEKYDQLNRRLRRQGNTAETLHVYHFLAKDSVEESVMYALRRKFKDEKQLLDALKARRRV